MNLKILQWWYNTWPKDCGRPSFVLTEHPVPDLVLRFCYYNLENFGLVISDVWVKPLYRKLKFFNSILNKLMFELVLCAGA